MDNLGFDVVTEETHLTPEPWEVSGVDSVDGVSPAALLVSLPKPEISLECWQHSLLHSNIAWALP